MKLQPLFALLVSLTFFSSVSKATELYDMSSFKDTDSVQLSTDGRTVFCFKEADFDKEIMTLPEGITGLNVSELQLDNEDIRLITKRYTQLRIFQTRKNEIGDRAMTYIAGLEHLEELDIMFNPHITGEGVGKILGLKNLRKLEASGTRLKNSGVEVLKPLMPQLDYLSLRGCGYDSSVLSHFSDLKKGAELHITEGLTKLTQVSQSRGA